MNNIFKTKWNAAIQSYVVCSELAKRAGKTVAVATVATLLNNIANATPIVVPNGATETLSGTKDITLTDSNNAVSISGTANITEGDTLKLNVTTDSTMAEFEPRGIMLASNNAQFNAEKATIDVSLSHKQNGKNIHPIGVAVMNGATLTAETLNVKVVDQLEVNNVEYPAHATYGVQVGTAITWQDNSTTLTSTLKVTNAEINVSNTEQTRKSSFSQTISLPFIGNTTLKVFDVHHQMAGLRVIRDVGSTSTPIFESTGKVSITVEDKTANKDQADYNLGIYVSGKDAKVILNDSEIKLIGNGLINSGSTGLSQPKHLTNSSALKIGKVRSFGDGNGTIESKGKMVLDTTNSPHAAAVRLHGDGSALKADFENSSAEIKTASSAIVYAIEELRLSGGLGDVSANSNAKNQEVSLKDAVITTTSDTASLIKTEAAIVFDTGNVAYAPYNDYNGAFAVTDAKLNLTGDKTNVTAAKNGWIIETEAAEQGTEKAQSQLSVSLDQGAKMTGMVHKHTEGTSSSTLNMSLDKGSTWTLAQKGNTGIRSTANSINLKNGAVLDASKILTTSNADAEAEVNTQQTALTVAETALTEANTELETAKNQLITAEALPTNTAARRRNRDRAIDTANEKIAEATNKVNQATLNKATVENELNLATKTKEAVDNNAAAYFIKLTSNGTDNDGTLINDGSVITQANSSSKDILTIEGNYEGKNGAVLKVNTDWKSPGDDVDGTDSISDLLVITGNASGSTIVQAIKADGSENVIDGDIGSIAADLYKNSAVVVRVKGTDNGVEGDLVGPTYKTRSSFTGEARTTGAGLLKLTSRVNTNNETEYFWTISQTNSTNSPTYDPVVPAYVLAPQANLELGYTTLATLHERRGENQTLAWDDCGTCGEKARGQSWGRIFGKHLELNGKTRLGAKHNIYGFQLGHDFAIQRTEEGGHRLTGGYVSYGTMNSTYSDRFDDEAQTGKGKQKGWSLGLTHTRYAPNGAYVDLVGQIGFLNNNYQARNGVEAKQKGTALALSVEVGRPYALREHKTNEGVWLIEPQAQLMYQMLKLKDFNDDIKHIKGSSHHGLRGRLGVRLAYNTQAAEDKYRTNTFYVIANLLQDFSKGKGVQIGQDKVKETFAKTWAEVGLGGQLPVGKQSYVYADARYERSLSGAKREGYRGTVGFKYTWK